MNLYDSDQSHDDLNESDGTEDGLNTMAVLSTLGGGGGAAEDIMGEGEPLGLDPEASKAKLSGSSLAVGVVVVLGACALLGMKLTLGSISGGVTPDEDITQIENFLQTQAAAEQTGVDGPIRTPDEESQRVLEELSADPTRHQVPAEEVDSNPFDISQIIARPTTEDGGDITSGVPTEEELREAAIERARNAAAQFTVNAIAGNIVFIDNAQYRVGDAIGNSGFILDSIDGLTCIIRTSDQFGIAVRLRYQ